VELEVRWKRPSVSIRRRGKVEHWKEKRAGKRRDLTKRVEGGTSSTTLLETKRGRTRISEDQSIFELLRENLTRSSILITKKRFYGLREGRAGKGKEV